MADPGFPEVGAPHLQGVQTYDFAKLSQKLHELKQFEPEGVRPKCYYVDPPLTCTLHSSHFVLQELITRVCPWIVPLNVSFCSAQHYTLNRLNRLFNLVQGEEASKVDRDLSTVWIRSFLLTNVLPVLIVFSIGLSYHSVLLCSILNLKLSMLLPPATKLRQGNGFYTCLSVILFRGMGWCLPLVPGWCLPSPWADTHPLGRHSPGRHPLGRLSPAQCMLGYTPLAQCMLGYTPLLSACWDTVNKRALRIPLECILVVYVIIIIFHQVNRCGNYHWLLPSEIKK